MYKLKSLFTSIRHGTHSRKVQVAFMILTIALFVISAAAPNATIGIGK